MTYNSSNVFKHEEEEETSKQDVIGFNSRRASDFSHCDYLRPTMSSMSRAKSVAPLKQRKEQKTLVSTIEENTSFDMST